MTLSEIIKERVGAIIDRACGTRDWAPSPATKLAKQADHHCVTCGYFPAAGHHFVDGRWMGSDGHAYAPKAVGAERPRKSR